MAPATRSKKVEITEDSTAQPLAAQVFPLSCTGSQIPPLSESAGNTMPDTDVPVETQLKDLKTAYRNALGLTKKNKKGKNRKKANMDDLHLTESSGDHSQAGRRDFLLSLIAGRSSAIQTLVPSQTIQNLYANGLNPEIAITPIAQNFPMIGTTPAEDDTATPNLLAQKLSTIETTPAGEEDSFVEQITSRSPAKQVSRIEDSVEALDEMEEVEETLQEAVQEAAILPASQSLKSSENLRSQSSKSSQRSGPARQPALPDTKAAAEQPPIKPGYQSMRVKSSAPKRLSVIKKAASMTFKPESSETSSIRGEAVKNERTRRAPILRPPTVKSTKPLTKPAFELPGEALSRKKREAHEAKLKAQEEEERKRREFKAKPVRKSIVSRDTAASRARHSKVYHEGVEDGKLSDSKRDSMKVGAQRPPIPELNNMANISAPRAAAPASPLIRKPSAKFHGPAMSGLTMQRVVSATEVQAQRQRAKEIYNRDQKMAEDMGREKREREAAAKRSREEAAERGRQASREWAEKQRAKKLAGGDKGMSAGYGPGGQLGLSA